MWDASKISKICEKVQHQIVYSGYMRKLVKQLTNKEWKTGCYTLSILPTTLIKLLSTCYLPSKTHAS